MSKETASELIQRQLDAFNAKDLEGLLATYEPNASQFTLDGTLLARGHEAMRPRFQARFSEPDLHAKLVSRSVMQNIVVDLEVITRNFPEGLGTVELLCIYEVNDGRISVARFAQGDVRFAS
jgi:hypothetical protein